MTAVMVFFCWFVLFVKNDVCYGGSGVYSELEKELYLLSEVIALKKEAPMMKLCCVTKNV